MLRAYQNLYKYLKTQLIALFSEVTVLSCYCGKPRPSSRSDPGSSSDSRMTSLPGLTSVDLNDQRSDPLE